MPRLAIVRLALAGGLALPRMVAERPLGCSQTLYVLEARALEECTGLRP